MSESQGGRGVYSDDHYRNHDRSNAQLLRRAVNQGWPIPRPARRRAVKRINEILNSENARPRDVAAAARVLLSASRVNLEMVTTTIKAHEYEVLTGRVDHLIDQNKMEDEGRTAARDLR
jgi:hypothetical protein